MLLKLKAMKNKTQIIIKGHLDKKWEESFEGMKILYKNDNTILIGIIIDEAKLHGFLNLIRDLNLRLISVKPKK